ncbi:MAG: RNA methyltransferase [Oscillospiraceae bacterium]|nr:RNA methyltransferase [Oscillospiraceae bacterium]
MPESITSRLNPLMTHIRKLAASSSYRKKCGEFLGDGVKLLQEAVGCGVLLRCVVHTPDICCPALPPEVRVVQVPDDVMKSISLMDAPQGVLFTAAMPALSLPDILTGNRYLALDGVQDPGNVGTILRTADAFGADALLLLPGCADLFNPKTVRASMGAVFRLPAWRCSLAELQAAAAASGLTLWGSALREDAQDVRDVDLRRAVVLVGSEGRGLSREALDACQGTLRIPMRQRCESLNAAGAAAVLLWEGFRPSNIQ